MTLPKIGDEVDRILEQLLKKRYDAVLNRWKRELARGRLISLYEFVIEGYGRGALASWAMHARWLAGIGEIPAKETLLELRRQAGRFAETVETRALAIFRQAGSKFDPGRYITLIAGVSLWNGFSAGAEAAGTEAGAQYKEWIRTYPAKHPRDWHDALEGAVIPVNRKFVLPGGPNAGKAVDGPHDWKSVRDPGEWLNCGHAIIYLNAATREELQRGAKYVAES
jgi:hypothetical protein